MLPLTHGVLPRPSSLIPRGFFFYDKRWKGSGDWPLKTSVEKTAFASSIYKFGGRR